MLHPFLSISRNSMRMASVKSVFSRNLTNKTGFMSRRFMSGAQMPKLNLFVGSVGTFCFVNSLQSKSMILNDTAFGHSPRVSVQTPSVSQSKPIHSRFGGKLDYQELTIGSVAGLFLGIIAGKMSSAIVFLTLSCYLLTQFLENRGIITIPWRTFVNIGSERIDVKNLVLNQPSFKISFVLSFLIAAFNV